MSRRRVKFWITPSIRWLCGAALLALAPKCLLCLAAYASAGTFLGLKLAGPEICGAEEGFPFGAMVWLLSASAALGVIALRATKKLPSRFKT